LWIMIRINRIGCMHWMYAFDEYGVVVKIVVKIRSPVRIAASGSGMNAEAQSPNV